MKVPLLDLKRQYSLIESEVMEATREIFQSQQFILGPRVVEFEHKAATYCGCGFAVGVSSGTDAILLSLMAAGVGCEDRVITTPYTFFATAGAISRVGARPVFVDIDPETYNMDPAALRDTIDRMEGGERSKLKAIIPVHLFGQCAHMEPILETARREGLMVIEDAAQAIGSEYVFSDGRIKRAGAMSHYGCFSFFPSKNLGAFGDAGMVTSGDAGRYERLKILRVHGAEPKYHHALIGGNFRLDALQAAILSIKISHLDEWTRARQKNAALYREIFAQKGLDEITPPKEAGGRHIYNQFVVRVGTERDNLRKFLEDNGIGCEVYYPVPLHMQGCFRYLNHRPDDFPVSRDAAQETLALPIFPELEENEIVYVTDIIEQFIKKARKAFFLRDPQKKA